MPTDIRAVTYEAKDGTRQTLTYHSGPELIKRREQFAQLVAYGADVLDAYCEAYGKTVTCDVDRRSFMQLATVLMKDTSVKIRIQELRRPIQRKLARKWEYTLDKALEDCQQAYDVAYHDGDSKAMQSCIRLRAELTKLLSGDINVNHKHTVLDEETTEVLVALRDAVKRKKAAVKVVNPEPEGAIQIT
jgi:hypothetical protein